MLFRSYISSEEVRRLVGPQQFTEMLDDNLDSIEDEGLFEALALDAGNQVEAYLAAKYTVPFLAPVPSFVRQCAKIFCAEMLYQRRGIAKDANPWTRQADTLRARLERIASGKDELDADAIGGADSVEFQVEPSRLTQEGRMMF